MDNQELLTCPFCGGDAQDDFIEGESYLIECYVCEANTGSRSSAEDAIAAWNRRAAPPVAESVAVPAGWVLVPIGPSDEMIEATFKGMVEVQCVKSQQRARAHVRRQYVTMIAAAPAAPTPQVAARPAAESASNQELTCGLAANDQRQVALLATIACSACYGSGYGVDGKACPCGCRPAAPKPPCVTGRITKDEAEYIRRLALDLEKTGRIASLSEGQEKSDFARKNREIQCALEDALSALMDAAPTPLPAGDGWQDAARYQWLSKRFAGYDFHWGREPFAEAKSASGKVVIVFEIGEGVTVGKNFNTAIDAAIEAERAGGETT